MSPSLLSAHNDLISVWLRAPHPAGRGQWIKKAHLHVIQPYLHRALASSWLAVGQLLPGRWPVVGQALGYSIALNLEVEGVGGRGLR